MWNRAGEGEHFPIFTLYFPNKLFHQRIFLLSRSMLISPQFFLEKKKSDSIKLCCCFYIVMLKSRKPIIKVSIDLSQCIYHFSSSSRFFPSHLDKKALRLFEHFQQPKMQPPASLRQSVAVGWHGAKAGGEGKKRRREESPVADRQDFAFPHRFCTSSCSLLCLQSPYLLLKDHLHLLLPSLFSLKSVTSQDIHSQC